MSNPAAQQRLDVFPQNPSVPRETCCRDFVEVAERVQRFQRREHLAPLRYDVHYPGGDALTQKQWALALSPARVEGRFAA